MYFFVSINVAICLLIEDERSVLFYGFQLLYDDCVICA